MNIFDKGLHAKTILLVLPGGIFNKCIFNALKELSSKKIGYVTINKEAGTIIDQLKMNKMEHKDFFFLDCVTKTISAIKDEPQIKYISSPNALTEISLGIKNCVDIGCEYVIIDSLSTLMIYHKSDVLSRFLHNLISKFRTKPDVRLLLTISEDDRNSDLFKKVELLVDEIIEVK